jgi:hypothetical protein
MLVWHVLILAMWFLSLAANSDLYDNQQNAYAHWQSLIPPEK